jgi:hypothetical protein
MDLLHIRGPHRDVRNLAVPYPVGHRHGLGRFELLGAEPAREPAVAFGAAKLAAGRASAPGARIAEPAKGQRVFGTDSESLCINVDGGSGLGGFCVVWFLLPPNAACARGGRCSQRRSATGECVVPRRTDTGSWAACRRPTGRLPG